MKLAPAPLVAPVAAAAAGWPRALSKLTGVAKVVAEGSASWEIEEGSVNEGEAAPMVLTTTGPPPPVPTRTEASTGPLAEGELRYLWREGEYRLVTRRARENERDAPGEVPQIGDWTAAP